MNALSRADEKLLNRLQIPQAQKLLLENHWLKKPRKKAGWSIADFFFMIIRPMMIAAFAAPYFTSGAKPFVNISLVLLWLFYAVGMMLHVIVTAVAAFYASDDKDETMDRIFAGFLPGADSRLKRSYTALSWAAIFGLTASEGYFLTSAIIAVCWMAAWILNRVGEGVVKSFLTKRVAEMPPSRIINVNVTRIQ